MNAIDPSAMCLENISVLYRVPTERINTLKEHVLRRVRGMTLSYREFWALKDVSFNIARGETLGLVGRNGAGKSTLLKVVARVLKPTSGRVVIRGKVAPIIELGLGFHPELTGSENILLSAALLGYSRSYIESRYQKIVDFSELADFIDAPIRTYSSGMVARLAFSIATDVQPDVLLVDEVLSVGDHEFQKKCIQRMRDFKEQGVTIIFVSHDADTVRQLCDRVVWIDGGKVAQIGTPDEVIPLYQVETSHPV